MLKGTLIRLIGVSFTMQVAETFLFIMQNEIRIIDEVSRMMNSFKSNHRSISGQYAKVEVENNTMTITANGKVFTNTINKNGKTRRDTTHMLNAVIDAVCEAYGFNRDRAVEAYGVYVQSLMAAYGVEA